MVLLHVGDVAVIVDVVYRVGVGAHVSGYGVIVVIGVVADVVYSSVVV